MSVVRSNFDVPNHTHHNRHEVPAVQRIVYSTCSIHAVENEHVVQNALRSFEARDFTLAPRLDVLPAWEQRGLTDELECPGELTRKLFEMLLNVYGKRMLSHW